MSNQFGPTGEFPRGKLNADDEGGLTLGITNDKGTVIISSGKPIIWIGMDPEQAMEFASSIMKNAQLARSAGER